MHMIIKRPVITEKSLLLASRGWYTFAVTADSSKGSIAQAVNGAYKVKVTEVRTTMMHGKVRRVGKLSMHVAKPDWKKAMVKLSKGQKIDVFEVAPTQEQAPVAKPAKEEKKK